MNSSEPRNAASALARTLYDGTGGPVRHDVIIEVVAGRITRVQPWKRGEQPVDVEEYSIVCPGFIDIQINGANDIQFNDDPTPEALSRISEGAARGGTAWILPTFITAQGSDYAKAIAATRTAIASGTAGILGLHLEGPFLSPKRPGIHEREAIRPMDADDLANLTAGFPGPLLLTLAPEAQPAGMIEDLTRQGVIVFCGHSEASHAEMQAAQQAGLSGATHLFNAMSQMQVREPGVVGAILSSASLYAGIIADGHHVHWANVAIAAQLMPTRLCLVTDAMCTLAGERTEFVLHGEKIRLIEGRLQNADGTLAGAHVAMDESVRNMIGQGICAPELAVRMASGNPAAALGLADRLGRVEPGYASGLALMNEEWQCEGVIRGVLAET